MKNYRITVNGVAYDVSVEELGKHLQSAHRLLPHRRLLPKKHLQKQQVPKAV